MKPLQLLPTLCLLVSYAATADDFPELRAALAARLPQVTVGEIRKLPYGDLYEVQGNGINVFYTDAHGDLGFFGNLVDLKTQTNLTEARKSELLKTDFSALPFDKAIVKVKGDGSRKLAVFSDPDCPYCKQLEQELAGVTNVTVYTFLFPLAELHPDAPRKARLIWCAADKIKAWDELMLDGKEPPAAAPDCEAPLGGIADVARKLWINGTPGMVTESGQIVPGVLPRTQIESLLQSAPHS
jgi:thiol:disulfide interchange protein DsbC